MCCFIKEIPQPKTLLLLCAVAITLLFSEPIACFSIDKWKRNEHHSIRIHHPYMKETHLNDRSFLLFSSGSEEGANIEDDDDESDFDIKPSSCNVLGTPLQPCCTNVGGSGIGTGFYRNGYCSTGDQDLGRHTVCIRATDDFLEYSQSVGNDLSTPVPEYMFPGLNEGDIWCLCAQRWAQAFNAGKQPQLFLQATHEKTLDYIPLEILMKNAIDKEEAKDVLDDLNEQREKLNRLL